MQGTPQSMQAPVGSAVAVIVASVAQMFLLFSCELWHVLKEPGTWESLVLVSQATRLIWCGITWPQATLAPHTERHKLHQGVIQSTFIFCMSLAIASPSPLRVNITNGSPLSTLTTALVGVGKVRVRHSRAWEPNNDEKRLADNIPKLLWRYALAAESH